ncbi:hypothetical protein [Yoonia sp. BS5-3]|uniref:Ceramidase n=1 Tax=Yoonia phaeophyticola TaxID=3137369 RepID=A0ABZ2V7U1_9RHOB
MHWFDHFDGYCERTDFTYWSEPINALTNLAFIIAAVIMWRRSAGLVSARVLCGILFAIGSGSYLFHTHATGWALLADVAPIGLFILAYIFVINRDVLGWSWWAALLGTLAFLPYAYIAVPVLNRVPFLAISNFYWTVPILILAYVPFLPKGTGLARGFAIGAGVLCLSITLRSVDELWCAQLPLGTHFLWHCLNAVMLGWMIAVYRRHMLAGRGAGL